MLPRLAKATSGTSRVGRFAILILGLAALAAPVVYLTRSAALVANDLTGEVAQAGVAPAKEFLPPLSESEKKITAELEKPTSMEFADSPLGDAIDYLRDLHNIEIQVDHKNLQDAGIDSEVLVTANLKGVSLRSALRRVLANLDLTYLVDDDMLLITTNELASNTLVTRTYPVSDLAADGDFKILVEAITETAKPASWNSEGGAGSITAVKNVRSLVISQTHAVHDEILQLLRSLRAAQQASAAGAK